jgi:eukaryotic-like serine/threonine-protein kinase
MSLSPGVRLGPYEIVSAIGAGGMGEVYRAQDTRLGRTVAIKILPADVAHDAQFQERFEREARAAGALNHPNICVLHDVGSADDVRFLVMEHLEGETLESRLKKGALPVAQALTHAIQIADALAAAHRHGIVHRDLKPGNVMLTRSGAKLLDFGLAKPTAAAVSSVAMSAAPTASPNITASGTIIGTIRYMAPEQLEGLEADARTDIFAFGVVLYEMVTGRKAFEGRSHASLIAAILEHQPPPMSTAVPLSPRALERTVKRCLDKDPDARWQAASDLAFELRWIADDVNQGTSEHSAPGHRSSRRRPILLAAGAVALALAAALPFIISRFTATSDEPQLVRLTFPPPESEAFGLATPAISPDGRHVAFVAVAPHSSAIWLRSLDSLSSRRIAGTEDARGIFWSPDSRFLGFFAAGKLKRISIDGGLAQTLADGPFNGLGGGGSWNKDGVIIFGAPGTGGIQQVSATGGRSVRVTTLSAERKETAHNAPVFLPDGRRFVFNAPPTRTIYMGSLDSSDVTELTSSVSKAVYSAGHLLFVDETTLVARPFDAARGVFTGDRVPIVERVGLSGGMGSFSVSDGGTLVYRNLIPGALSQATIVDRGGKPVGTISAPADYRDMSLSPDGTRLVVHRHDDQMFGGALWLIDAVRGTTSRLTFSKSHDPAGVWSPDGTSVAFGSNREGGVMNIFIKPSTGAVAEQPLVTSQHFKIPTDWASDGTSLVYDAGGGPTRGDIWVLPLTGDRKPFPFLATPANEWQGRLSPDVSWIAYVSNETGRNEVYVQPFPSGGGKWQISTGGGLQPRWRRDGKELFYLAPTEGADLRLTAVDVRAAGAAFEAGLPKPLFSARFAYFNTGAPLSNTFDQTYAPTADGRQFVMLAPAAGAPAEEMKIVINWPLQLNR